jgi:hypothetical protein
MESFLAVASDEIIDIHIPILNLNDVVSIANFIENKFFNRT